MPQDQPDESNVLRPRTLEQCERQMVGLERDLVLYIWHLSNGREEEAESYLNAYRAQQSQVEAIPVSSDRIETAKPLAEAEVEVEASQPEPNVEVLPPPMVGMRRFGMHRL